MLPAKIRRIEFKNVKALSDFSLDLQGSNILFGPNNTGKSTIIGALRALDSSIKAARARAPSTVFAGEQNMLAGAFQPKAYRCLWRMCTRTTVRRI